MSVANSLVDGPSHGLGLQHDQGRRRRGDVEYFMCLRFAGSGVCPRVGRGLTPSGAAGRVIAKRVKREGAEKSETELGSAPEERGVGSTDGDGNSEWVFKSFQSSQVS